MSDETRSIPPVEPVLDPKKDYVEINSYVVFWGLFYAAIFTLTAGATTNNDAQIATSIKNFFFMLISSFKF